MYKNLFNIYCDESRVENLDSSKMVIGALFIPREKRDIIVGDIKNIFNKHNFHYELKWVKLNKRFEGLYKELIDYFFSQESLQYRCIIVDKTKVKLKEFHENDSELSFFKFYYFMLRTKLASDNKYYIFIDRKPTRDKNRARALFSFLNSYVLLHRRNCNIEHLQAYNSSENIIIQYADFFTGLIGYACNTINTKTAKSRIVEYFKVKSKKDICSSTPLLEEKINIFAWKETHEKS